MIFFKKLKIVIWTVVYKSHDESKVLSIFLCSSIRGLSHSIHRTSYPKLRRRYMSFNYIWYFISIWKYHGTILSENDKTLCNVCACVCVCWSGEQLKNAGRKLGRRCDMCSNYEKQLQVMQGQEAETRDQVRLVLLFYALEFLQFPPEPLLALL